MTTEALYYQTKLQVNKLGTGVGQDLSPAVFATLYNAAQTSWWKTALPTRNDSLFRETLETLLITDKSLVPTAQQDRVYTLPIEVDTYQITDVLVKAFTPTCSRSFPATYQPSSFASSNWTNPLTRPSFDWEETWYNRSGGKLQVYYTDFSVESILLSYYQLPPPVDLPGYINLEGTPSTLKNSPLPDELQQEILSQLIQSLT